LWALVHGLPPEASTWREDVPKWTARDEWAASTIEVIERWGTELLSGLIALGGSKPRLPRPERIEHPDRPEPEPVKPKNVLSVAEFERQISGEATTP
jgi:hypothetical protein